MKDLLIKSLITVITLAVISFIFIFFETLPIVSFIIAVSLSLFMVIVGVYLLIEYMGKKEKDKNDLID